METERGSAATVSVLDLVAEGDGCVHAPVFVRIPNFAGIRPGVTHLDPFETKDLRNVCQL